uniref:Putative secreted protein n=1 Tax=Amblyomma cajennense TaxID=34607 RepID=A0A023FBX3_AMBCJ
MEFCTLCMLLLGVVCGSHILVWSETSSAKLTSFIECLPCVSCVPPFLWHLVVHVMTIAADCRPWHVWILCKFGGAQNSHAEMNYCDVQTCSFGEHYAGCRYCYVYQLSGVIFGKLFCMQV